MTAKITVEMPRHVAQLIANFIAAQTFETFAQFTSGKAETYDLRDAASFLLRRLQEHVSPSAQISAQSSGLLYVKIPLRHVRKDQRHSIDTVISSVQRAILKGTPLPGWAIADFDAGNVEVVECADVEIKPIPELPS